MAPGALPSCRTCEVEYPLLDRDTCALCDKLLERIGAGVDPEGIDKIRERIKAKEQQCLSCSAIFVLSETSRKVCGLCIKKWGSRSDVPQWVEDFIEAQPATPHVPPLAQPAKLQASRASSTVPHSSGAALYARADELREGASSLRLTSGSSKPTTSTKSPSIPSFTGPDEFKAKKEQIKHAQKQAVNTRIAINAEIVDEGAPRAQKSKSHMYQQTFGPSASALKSLADVLEELKNVIGGNLTHVSLKTVRMDAVLPGRQFPTVTMHTRFNETTTMEHFYEWMATDALLKVTTRNPPTIHIRFVIEARSETRKAESELESEEGGGDSDDDTAMPTAPRSPPRHRVALPSVTSLSAFGPLASRLPLPKVPTPPPPPPLSYKWFVGEDWEIKIERVDVHEDGTPFFLPPEEGRIELSTYFREHPYVVAAARPHNVYPVDFTTEYGDGYVGEGGSKVVTFGVMNKARFAIAVPKSGWNEHGVPLWHDSLDRFAEQLRQEALLNAQAEYFAAAFRQRVTLAQELGVGIEDIPAIRFATQNAFIATLVKPIEASFTSKLDDAHRYGDILPVNVVFAMPYVGYKDSVTLHFSSHDPAEDGHEASKEHPKHCDAVNAFAHFVFLHSRGRMILVDLQGIIQDDGSLTMFDPQAHTTDRGPEAPYYDLGQPSVQSFVEHHKCSAFCEALDLDALLEFDPDAETNASKAGVGPGGKQVIEVSDTENVAVPPPAKSKAKTGKVGETEKKKTRRKKPYARV